MASNYGNRIKKKASEMETVIKPEVEVDNNNMFVASMMQNHKEETQKETKKTLNFKTKPEKVTDSFYIERDVIEKIHEIANETPGLNKSILVENILREFLVKHGYLDKK